MSDDLPAPARHYAPIAVSSESTVVAEFVPDPELGRRSKAALWRVAEERNAVTVVAELATACADPLVASAAACLTTPAAAQVFNFAAAAAYSADFQKPQAASFDGNRAIRMLSLRGSPSAISTFAAGVTVR